MISLYKDTNIRWRWKQPRLCPVSRYSLEKNNDYFVFFISGELSLYYGVKVNVYDNDKLKVKNANFDISQQKEELLREGLIDTFDSYVSFY